MGRFACKLKQLCGETLVETLAAVLLCGVTAALLMSSLGTASTLNQDAKTITKQEQVQATNAAGFAGYWQDGAQVANSTGAVTFTDKGNAALTETFSGEAKVKVFGGPLLVSYQLQEAVSS